jgi:hypothetical protein
MSRSSGPLQLATEAVTDTWSAKSSRLTRTAALPVVAAMIDRLVHHAESSP